MSIPGDLYHIHYARFDDTNTYESELGPCATWLYAKQERNRIFQTFGNVKACWIMKRNLSMNLQDEKWGETLRRRRPQALSVRVA